MRLTALVLAALSLTLVPGAAEAVETRQIGAAVTVVNLVTAELDRDTRSLQVGDRVHEYENIQVGLDAKGELKLDDETKLALGPGSRLKLDKFVYDADKSDGSIVLDLVKGTFRFITGVASKPTYVIRTPSAAITVRGTIFDLYVEEDGMTWLLLHEGVVRVCGDRGNCRLIDEIGKLMRIIDGDVGAPVKWAALPGKDAVPFDTAFPFVAAPPTIDPTPILTRDVIILGNLPDEDKPKQTETKKPKKKAERTPSTDTPPQKKKKKTAKKSSSDDASNIVGGMDIVIGIGGSMGGKRGGGHKAPKGDMPRGGMKY
jgi:hypothetical protein